MKQPVIMFNVRHYNESISHIGYDFQKKLIVVAFKQATSAKLLSQHSELHYEANKLYVYSENVSQQAFDALMQLFKDKPDLISDYSRAILAKPLIAYIYSSAYQMQGVNALGEVSMQSNVLHDMVLNLNDWHVNLRKTLNDRKDDPSTAIQSFLSAILNQPSKVIA